jgi:hypothetical protein
MTANRKFERERDLVELLMRRRALTVDKYIDPQQEAHDETGADVIAVIEGRRIGIQVTELDTGDRPGQARAAEKILWREAQEKGQGTYAAWAQNDPSKLVSAIARAIASKVQHIVGCDEAWLLVSASVPEQGSLVSTFIITPWLPLDALEAATADHLAKCKYNCAFLHAIVGDEHALYCWTPGSSWEKLTVQDQSNQGPGFFEWRDQQSEFQEWMTDTEGKTDREVEKVRREFQTLRGQGKPLPAFIEADGEWIAEGYIFLYHSGERASAAKFTMQAARHDGELCVGFDSSQLAAAIGVDVETVVTANQNGTLILLGTADVPPIHGGASAKEYGFRIGDKQGSLTIEIDQRSGQA